MRDDVNPYVNKIKEESEYIIPCNFNKIEESEKLILDTKIAKFEGVIVEICSGSGKHLIEIAKKYPQFLIVGFELRFKRIYMTAKKAKKEELNNVILIRNDARNLKCWFKNNSISKLFINFPNPCDKDRCEKHRLLSNDFFNDLSLILVKNGEFLYKTDHKERFLDTKEFLDSNKLYKISEFTEDLYNSPYLENNVKTEFESLFLSQGLKINYLKAIRL